jgi:hypothetical protein
VTSGSPCSAPLATESSNAGLARDASVAVGFVAVAVLLRFGPLGPPSLWLDDAWPALVTRVPWREVHVVGLTSSGYSAVLKAWLHLSGFSELHAQIPAFVFGVLGPAAVYITARRMALRSLPAVIAGVIVLVSRDHIVYSSRVKQYTLDALLATAVIYLAYAVIQDPQSARRWWRLVVMAAVATAASSLVVTTVVGALLAAAIAALRQPGRTLRQRARLVGYALVTYGVFAVAWYLVALRSHINPSLKRYWAAFYIRLDTHFPRDLGEALLRVAHGMSTAPSGVGLAVLIASAIVVVRKRPDLAVLLVTPIVVAALLATLQLAPLGAGRTDLNLYPALALLVGVAVSELPNLFRASHMVTVVIAVLILLAIIATVRPAPAYPIEDMRAASAYLEANARPSDEVLVYWAGRYPFALYARSWPLQIDPSRDTAEGFEVRVQRPNLYVLADHSTDHGAYASVLASLTRNQSRVWFIGSHGRLDVVAIQKDLSALGYHATHRRSGDSYRAFATLWVKTS